MPTELHQGLWNIENFSLSTPLNWAERRIFSLSTIHISYHTSL